MTNTNKPSVLFWIIGVVALLWNAMGVNAYIQQAYKTDAFKAMYPDKEVLEMVLNTPSWVMAAFAIAVFGGTLGCIFLLLRKKIATPIFLLSLIGIIVQMFYNLFISKALEVYGPGAVIMPIMVLALGLFLYFYSKKVTQKGWLS
ncbi:hypothetical protein WH52_01835 [Tenacibaculum holothuriorum]|uniref:Sugar transporter n=1 Tax=Tenacibaculum holothuriorum TaxID=1635173 RepID=A0A1Y2PI39_9FLAO|nr:hypothetical protein [Tenacibaculum holothuriorum]OSY89399.1 hypothetical protein WH52_01835 [Tenacibaculum holothuriorum]